MSDLESMTPTEARIATIFGELVGLEFIGPEEDVYELGADSIDVVRIGLELEREFGVELPPDLFEGSGTPRQIAAYIEQMRATAA